MAKTEVKLFNFSAEEIFCDNLDECGICGGNDECLIVEDLGVPENYSLGSIYPNPFNPKTTISFAIPEASNVTIEVFNLNGRRVSTLVNNAMLPGYHNVIWNGDSHSTGVYFVQMVAREFIFTQKLMLVK